MHAQKIFYVPSHPRETSFLLPEIPPGEWCDFRRDYECGMTLKNIAEKYFCDPRTVRKCILQNKSSSELGKQTAPTKLAPYITQIQQLFETLTTQQQVSSVKETGICFISQQITQHLRTKGYTGSERTVRNYLRNKYQSIKHPITEVNQYDPDQNNP